MTDTEQCSPFPEVGTTWKTPYGMDRCMVCACRGGIFLSDDPGLCKCGAEYAGLSTTELVAVPDRGEHDVLIRASDDDLQHKVFDYMDVAGNDVYPRRSLAFWRVQGTPQRTGPGRAILFSTDGETVDYYAPICYVEEGRIWFDFLHPVRFDTPENPPTRGFTYVNWGEFPW